ncbi:MAG: MBL fold metallo-hydrolase [Desulfobacteraceae bacterium]|jgi:7,8-dihydropterin-6-yl-methyl-4-(beta-D-ribofuranosyl)aminobenzene 5'-phosphate synthase|nr:MBL fold metallo-hydrolase [Desulfobacteraceae bacterium]
MIALYIILILIALIALIFIKKVFQLSKGKKAADTELAGMKINKLSSPGTVKSLSILPLVDYYSDNANLKTEPGVSYLVSAGDTNILLDIGFNKKKEHPSPLLQNMKTLGISVSDIDMIFFSHLHLDHVGGMTEQTEKTFSLSQGPVSIPNFPVYSPIGISASKWNPGPEPQIIKDPVVLKEGIASIGVIPRYLFLMGYTLENALAINVAGKGIALIIGCGHQTIERIIERAQALFDEPIYAIIGGLHYPVNGGRIMIGPLNIQRIVGSDRPPWISIQESDVKSAIEAIKKVSPKIVALSPHDSSDWCIDQFKQAFGDTYVDVNVGQKIEI